MSAIGKTDKACHYEQQEEDDLHMNTSGFNLSDFDDMVHSQARLAVLTFLATVPTASFLDLKNATGLSDGNLSVHVKKLEGSGYVLVEKSFVNRRPRTTVSLTETGRSALMQHLNRLEDIVRQVKDLKKDL